jgi:hypothetical protein
MTMLFLKILFCLASYVLTEDLLTRFIFKHENYPEKWQKVTIAIAWFFIWVYISIKWIL